MKKLTILATLAALLVLEASAWAQRRGTISGTQSGVNPSGVRDYNWLPNSRMYERGRGFSWLPNNPAYNGGRNLSWLPNNPSYNGTPGNVPTPRTATYNGEPSFLNYVPQLYLPR